MSPKLRQRVMWVWALMRPGMITSCAVNGLGTDELAGAGAILVHSQHGSDLAAVHQ